MSYGGRNDDFGPKPVETGKGRSERKDPDQPDRTKVRHGRNHRWLDSFTKRINRINRINKLSCCALTNVRSDVFFLSSFFFLFNIYLFYSSRLLYARLL